MFENMFFFQTVTDKNYKKTYNKKQGERELAKSWLMITGGRGSKLSKKDNVK